MCLVRMKFPRLRVSEWCFMNKVFVYADNAATTRLDPQAFEAMKPFLLDEYSNPSQPYSFSRNSKKALREARETIAACINAEPDEIFFTSGGTESDNWAIKGSAYDDFQKRATVTSEFEHHAVLRSCAAIEKHGYPVAYMQPTSEGYITPEILEEYITKKTRLVSVMYANNEIGSIQPIKELCENAHFYGSLFHTDAVQATGHIKIDVRELGIDMLSASAHKFNGPKGVGFLYIKKDVSLIPFLDGGSQERKHRAGTENVAGIVGMAKALENNCSFLEKNRAYIVALEQQLLEYLNKSGIEYARNGGNNTLPGLLSLSFKGFSGETILHRMDLMGICISTGSACDSVDTQVSHVLRSIRLDETLAKGTIRISLGKDNTVEEVDGICRELIRIIKNDR